jgi:hypothetical protein
MRTRVPILESEKWELFKTQMTTFCGVFTDIMATADETRCPIGGHPRPHVFKQLGEGKLLREYIKKMEIQLLPHLPT